MKTSPLQSWQNFWSRIRTLQLPLTLASSPPLLESQFAHLENGNNSKTLTRFSWGSSKSMSRMGSGPELLLITPWLFCYYYHDRVGQDKRDTGVNGGRGWRVGKSELRMSTDSLRFQMHSLGRGCYAESRSSCRDSEPSSGSKIGVQWPKPHNLFHASVHETGEKKKNLLAFFAKITKPKWSWRGTRIQPTDIRDGNGLGEVTEIEIATHLTSGVFLSLLRNSLPVGIFIFRTNYFINVFIWSRKKKTVVTNTSKFFLARKGCSVLFLACKIMDFVVFHLPFT